MRGQLKWAGLLVVVAFAGCSADPPAARPAEVDFEEYGPATSDEAGAIAGLVLDESLLPAAAATVALSSPSGGQLLATQSTDANGSFLFSLLQPGTYQVAATGAGSSTTDAQLVLVAAGEVTRIQLILRAAASDAPYIDVHIKSGILRCAAAVILVPSSNWCDALDQGAKEHVIIAQVPPTHRALVSESVWRSQSEHLLFQFRIYSGELSGPGGKTIIGESWGGPPLRIQWLPGELKAPLSRESTNAPNYVPVPVGQFRLWSEAFYSGHLSTEANATFNPACRNLLGRCAGVGATAEMRFDQFLSIFVNGTPGDLDRYTVIPDE